MKAYRFQQWLETKSVRFSVCRGGSCREYAGDRLNCLTLFMEGKMGLSVGEETRFGMNHGAEEGPKERRKNVIWFISDQHRGQAMGIHGDPNV